MGGIFQHDSDSSDPPEKNHNIISLDLFLVGISCHINLCTGFKQPLHDMWQQQLNTFYSGFPKPVQFLAIGIREEKRKKKNFLNLVLVS